MDSLMTEATDLILSSNKNFSKDLNSALAWERRKSSLDLNDASSITLLRKSITKSLKERPESEVIDSFIPKRRKSRRRKGSYSGKPKIDVQFLDSEIYTEEKKEGHQSSSTEHQCKVDAPENDLTTLFTEECNPAEKIETSSEINLVDISEDRKNNYISTSNDSKKSVEPDSIEIGLKLAQRNFSESIFENCSTYSLTCPEVHYERKSSISPKQQFGNLSENFSQEISKSHSDTLHHLDDTKSENNGEVKCSDDQISLRDSFFVNVNGSDDDNILQNTLPSNSSDCSSVSKRSSMLSLSKEVSVFDEIKFDTEKSQLRRERKLSKKERKKQKRNKSNDTPVYECSKCGVSYILSNNASLSTARCLHCDFWKSVEPVFVKREKQPWNTCRIC